MLNFRKASVEDLPLLKRYSNRITTTSYEYKPSYIIWKEATGLELAEGKYGLYLYQSAYDTYLFPFTDAPTKAIEELTEGRDRVVIAPMCKECLDLLPDSFSKERDRDNDDYIYLEEKLATLSGKKLSAKRNHIRQFEKTYTYTFSALRPEDFQDCIDIDNDWEEHQDEKMRASIEEEKVAIKNCFEIWDKLDFRGSIMRVDGKAVAFTVGEKVDDDMAIIHFEKGDTNYIGIYPAINFYNVNALFSDVVYINREEDMGLEGLRRAKESYHPEMMGEKWKCTYERG